MTDTVSTLLCITIGSSIGWFVGAIIGNLLVENCIKKKKKINNLISFLTDLENPSYFEDKFGEEGIKWDKLSERTENVMRSLSSEDRREFFVKLVSNKNFEECFRTVSEYENKLNNKEK